MISINGQTINVTIFPDNTSQVWKLPIETYKSPLTVIWKYCNEAEIMQLAQLKCLLDQQPNKLNPKDLLQTIFKDGQVTKTQTLSEIRTLVRG